VSPRDVAVDALLAAAVLVALLSCLGVLAMSDVYERLHFLTPLGVVMPPLVALAVLIREGVSQQAVKAALVAVALCVSSPVLGHATARAARIRERGDWRPPPDARRVERRT
jgi:monovalent cation/proton antiporter MnhG/PhaG subunit